MPLDSQLAAVWPRCVLCRVYHGDLVLIMCCPLYWRPSNLNVLFTTFSCMLPTSCYYTLPMCPPLQLCFFGGLYPIVCQSTSLWWVSYASRLVAHCLAGEGEGWCDWPSWWKAFLLVLPRWCQVTNFQRACALAHVTVTVSFRFVLYFP